MLPGWSRSNQKGGVRQRPVARDTSELYGYNVARGGFLAPDDHAVNTSAPRFSRPLATMPRETAATDGHTVEMRESLVRRPAG
jgi:hypothetical protein